MEEEPHICMVAAASPRLHDIKIGQMRLTTQLAITTVGLVTTRNVATPGNVAKKTLPENVANFVGGYIFGEPHAQKCSRA